jgi:hydrogenase/urease accessory protein HupE
MTVRNEFELIPMPAKIIAVLVFIGIVVAMSWAFDSHHVIGIGTIFGVVTGAVAAAFILLAGYVYGDSARRAMSPAAWTALALLVPNGVGFVLYFLLRKPLTRPCSRCGNGVAPNDAYCPRCGQPQWNAAA